MVKKLVYYLKHWVAVFTNVRYVQDLFGLTEKIRYRDVTDDQLSRLESAGFSIYYDQLDDSGSLYAKMKIVPMDTVVILYFTCEDNRDEDYLSVQIEFENYITNSENLKGYIAYDVTNSISSCFPKHSQFFDLTYYPCDSLTEENLDKLMASCSGEDEPEPLSDLDIEEIFSADPSIPENSFSFRMNFEICSLEKFEYILSDSFRNSLSLIYTILCDKFSKFERR